MSKEAHELAYWKNVHERESSVNKDGKLGNTHYQRFYTDFFGFSKEDYIGKRILDVGCGPRGSLDWIADEAHADGIDPCADEYRKLNSVKMNLIQGNVEIYQSNEGYDFICSFNSLDHVDDLDAAILNIYSLLKPDGAFLLLSDIHRKPTVCEPSAFDWDIVKRLTRVGFEIKWENHYEKHIRGLYRSLDDAQKFNHDNTTERYGVIAVLAHKPID